MTTNTVPMGQRDVNFDKFFADLQQVPEISGHPWRDLATYGRGELLSLERQLAFDLAQMHRQMGDDLGWSHAQRHAAGKVIRIRGEQVSAVRTPRRKREREGSSMFVAYDSHGQRIEAFDAPGAGRTKADTVITFLEASARPFCRGWAGGRRMVAT